MNTTIKTTDSKGRTYEYVEGDTLKTRIYTLANGLKVYLSPNDRKPEIQVLVGVKAGSNNDPEDATGLAHYLEHLMFKGTKTIGTTDYAKEKPLLDEIEALFEEYGATTDPEQRKEIYRKIDAVSNEASKMAIPQESWKLFESIGATMMNAATGKYRTFFQCVIPSTEIRRWAILESERFINPVFRGFHTELETVYEEFNMRSANDSLLTDRLMNEVNRHLFSGIPYFQHTVLGKPEHLKNPSLRKLKEFYKTYYCANNMAVVLCGDLDFEKTMDIIEEHFGKLVRNDSLPVRKTSTSLDLTAPVHSTVTDPGQERMYLAWKIPGMVCQTESADWDTQCIIMALIMLRNGYCGLLDDFVNVDHKAVSANVFMHPDEDYNTLYLTAQPNEGQSLDEIKEGLLRLLDRLKSGDFENARLYAAINQFRKNNMKNMTDNMSRADSILSSFCQGIPYDRSIEWLERMSGITKEDVARVARKYMTDGYVYVQKLTGPSEDVVIEKPEISPLAVNGDLNSDFARDFLAMDSDKIEPRFADFRRDLSICSLPTGQELVYCHNDVDSLFSLTFTAETGCVRDKWLFLADDAMDKFGTDRMGAGERRMRLFEMASTAALEDTCRRTSLVMTGLQENIEETLDIATDWTLNARPDEKAFRDQATAFNTAQRMKKDDFMACQKAVYQIAMYGEENFLDRKTITKEQLKGFSGEDMVDHVHALARHFGIITYYGPASQDEVITMLNGSALVAAFDGCRQNPDIMPCRTVTEPEVMLLDYDSPSAFVTLQAGWGASKIPGDEALYELFNRYMYAIAEQEIREVRSLAYNSMAGYTTAFCKGEGFHFYTIALTQNSKLRECIETTEGICRKLPLSENMFSRVKEQLIASLRTRRRLDCDLIADYCSAKCLGYDHDPSEDVYRDVQGLTLKDLEVFHRSHLADNPFLYAVVGKISELDLDYLRSKGRVTVLTKEDAFGY